MLFNTFRKKLSYTFQQINNNLVELPKKINTSTPTVSKITEKDKVPNILYDSGWIIPGVLRGSVVEGNSNIYLAYSYNTTKKNQQTPFSLFYHFSTELDIPDNLIAFIHPTIMLQKYTDVEIEGVYPFCKYIYDFPYYKIYGDTTKIYEGYSPSATIFSDAERIFIGLNISLLSKWFYGTIEWTSGGDSYKLENGYVDNIITWYDKVDALNYKTFTCPAIDGLSSTTVNGTGTYSVVTAGTGVVTKNVTMSAPLFQNNTFFTASGTLYKNGVWQGYYSNTNPYTINFLIGTYSLISFNYSWVGDHQNWKLFYSNKRAKQFRFNTGTDAPINVPLTSDYQTGALPYSHLYIQKNPDDYPLITESSTTQLYASERNLFYLKLAPNKYRIYLKGTIRLSAPAIFEKNTLVAFVGETYSQVGTTYSRDSANRDDKNMPIYYPQEIEGKIRFLISFKNPLSYMSQ